MFSVVLSVASYSNRCVNLVAWTWDCCCNLGFNLGQSSRATTGLILYTTPVVWSKPSWWSLCLGLSHFVDRRPVLYCFIQWNTNLHVKLHRWSCIACASNFSYQVQHSQTCKYVLRDRNLGSITGPVNVFRMLLSCSCTDEHAFLWTVCSGSVHVCEYVVHVCTSTYSVQSIYYILSQSFIILWLAVCSFSHSFPSFGIGVTGICASLDVSTPRKLKIGFVRSRYFKRKNVCSVYYVLLAASCA